tara:strand:+ start:70 stop:507 length:438 start_codon:yes stop_codon:yes gene_type:complete
MGYASDKTAETVQISTVARKKGWADLDLSLTPHGVTKDIMPLKDDRAIKNAVRNLILTNFYERPFQHNKGANLKGLLFEPADYVTRLELKEGIKEVLAYHEPRISCKMIEVQDQAEINAYKVIVHFLIKEINAETTVSIVLKRLR